MQCWMRVLTVTLSNANDPNKRIVFGNKRDDLSIVVSGHKYMSSLKDSCSIKITNLTYSEVIQIVDNKYFNVEVVAGYEKGSVQTIFKGGVLYISNSLESDKSNTIIILCASSLIARYNQSRINLSLNSGINMYAAIKYAARKIGLIGDDTNISDFLKTMNLPESALNCQGTIAQWVNSIAQARDELIVSTDESLGGKDKLSIFNASRQKGRYIVLTNNMIDLNGGYPQLSKDGLTMTISPTFALKPGDTIHIDNSIVSVPVRSQSEISSNPAMFFNTDGDYMIYAIDYELANRSPQFSVNITAKKRNLISDFIGG